jgi:hypothetical protein
MLGLSSLEANELAPDFIFSNNIAQRVLVPATATTVGMNCSNQFNLQANAHEEASIQRNH